MANSFFNLTLDTLGPVGTLVIGTGAAKVNTAEVTLHINHKETDVVQMKIWGDVDTAFDNQIQATEGDSAWLSYSATKAIRLSTSEGSKTIYCKLKDDVSNEGSSFSATVTLDATVPVVTVTSGPTPAKISKITGKNTSEFAFQSSEDFVSYKVTVVSSSAATQETAVTIASTNGSTGVSGSAGNYTASTPISVTISGAVS